MNDAAESPRYGYLDLPALVTFRGSPVAVSSDGELIELTTSEALRLLERGEALVCHGPFTARRLGADHRTALHPALPDILELFAFVRPARFTLPTPSGLVSALGLDPPANAEDAAAALFRVARSLLDELRGLGGRDREAALGPAELMAGAGWPWRSAVLEALGHSAQADPRSMPSRYDVTARLETWEERAPPEPPGSEPVGADEAAAALRDLFVAPQAPRPGQEAYVAAVTAAFAPKESPGHPNVVLAEAGTGIGKTLGYLTPARIWAGRNGAPVWLSTYTKALQRQLDQEISRLFPDPREKAQKAVIRKGRENYLCLLNLDEAIRSLAPRSAVRAGLVARWAHATRDGAMIGGDFPAWLPSAPAGQVIQLTDRRGECIYTACPHYRKCFIEKGIRSARRADLVVANHALVLTRAALEFSLPARPTVPHDAAGAEDEVPAGQEPVGRFVFDEGHHLFEAADNAFSAHFTVRECNELRRWIRGPEARARRGRGLRERVGDLLAGDPEAESALDRALGAAAALPGPGWQGRLGSGQPSGPAETVFALIRTQVLARSDERDSFYTLETDTRPPVADLVDALPPLREKLDTLENALRSLVERLRRQLDEKAGEMETTDRVRLDATARGLERRALVTLPAWWAMLKAVDGTSPEGQFDWFALERQEGRDFDVGMHRHWIDPTVPFAEAVLEPAQGAVITSATLRDRRVDDMAEEGDETWSAAEARTGVIHLPVPVARFDVASPFDYARNSRVLVVRDVARDDLEQVAAAYRELFAAARGGGLGLFTAIARLRAVHPILEAALADRGISLYAQHVDAMDPSVLADIFRAETDSCLLGTDTFRDGVDVPGQSLRLIVLDRVPWPRPTLIHKQRKAAFGGARYDDMVTRFRLKQAFGRLIRSETDRGVFVMLDARTPSRLLDALPPSVPVSRLGLADAVAELTEFLSASAD